MNLAIFDIDGTLIQPVLVEDECYLQALDSALGLADVDPDWSGYSQVTDTGLVRELCRRRWGRAPTPHELTRFREAYCAALIARMGAGDAREIPGASSFLKELRRRPDWHVAIATGNFRDLAMHKLRDGGLPCLDVAMATADDAAPRTELIRLAIRKARARLGAGGFGHVVYVGDAPWDLRAAREIGVPFLAVGDRCGAAPGRAIRDYTDGTAVRNRLAGATCW